MLSPEDKKSADLILLIGYLSICIDRLEDAIRENEEDRAVLAFCEYIGVRQLIELNFSYPCITSKLHRRETSKIAGTIKYLKKLAAESRVYDKAAFRDYAALAALIKKYYDVTPKSPENLGRDAYAMYSSEEESLYPAAFPDKAGLYELAVEYREDLVRYKQDLARGRL